MGFIRAARIAGAKPNTIPVSVALANEASIADTEKIIWWLLLGRE